MGFDYISTSLIPYSNCVFFSKDDEVDIKKNQEVGLLYFLGEVFHLYVNLLVFFYIT